MGDYKGEYLWYLRHMFNLCFKKKEWFPSPSRCLDLDHCCVKVIITASYSFIGNLTSRLWKIPSTLVFLLWSFSLARSVLFVVVLVLGHSIIFCQVYQSFHHCWVTTLLFSKTCWSFYKVGRDATFHMITFDFKI